MALRIRLTLLLVLSEKLGEAFEEGRGEGTHHLFFLFPRNGRMKEQKRGSPQQGLPHSEDVELKRGVVRLLRLPIFIGMVSQ